MSNLSLVRGPLPCSLQNWPLDLLTGVPMPSPSLTGLLRGADREPSWPSLFWAYFLLPLKPCQCLLFPHVSFSSWLWPFKPLTLILFSTESLHFEHSCVFNLSPSWLVTSSRYLIRCAPRPPWLTWQLCLGALFTGPRSHEVCQYPVGAGFLRLPFFFIPQSAVICWALSKCQALRRGPGLEARTYPSLPLFGYIAAV